MIKSAVCILNLIFIFLFPLTKNVFAVENPLAVTNNRFGIHILEEADLEDAAKLVNSTGGDWGYVTLVIRSDERDKDRWQRIFNKMRRHHLIPILRIASKQTENGWEKPPMDEIDGWVSFLNELNWVIQNRYIVVGNEPNHAKEWGGDLNPEEYALYLQSFSEKLKSASEDFFVLPAGFDASAPNGKETMSEEQYITRMLNKNPKIFDYVDGWTSHSYPNPGFSGSKDDTGRGTITTFKWELEFLKKQGVNNELPVFITETGWRHDMETEAKVMGIEDVSTHLKASYELAWNEPNIVAITPFVLNYQDPPFNEFSWKKKEGGYYNFYFEVQNLPKVKGEPKQIDSVDIVTIIFPPIFPNRGTLNGGIASIRNKGQRIWTGKEKIRSQRFDLIVELQPKVIFSDIEPGETAISSFSIVGKNK